VRLKSVKIYGFKSFADKTEVDVDGNLVAVVGPNGCGKSNLVDAILWALGEASVKNLRAGASADVIFAGSARRKALSYAEVVLTFDNESRELPVDTTEVTVTRRVDRSGEGHYAINGRACRLRDIYELFADTGLGRTGYAIVTQSDIDSALNASPEARRVWIDEAAGVQRYRTRKKESLSRLESALIHLRRVDDVLREIDIQREPLREEAEAAATYKEKLGTLREMESGLLILEAARLQDQITSLAAKILDRRSQSEALRKLAESDEASIDSLRLSLATAESEIEAATGRVQHAISSVERAEAKRALAIQRLASLDEIDQGREREEESSRARLERAEKALEVARRELTDAESAVGVLLQVIGGSEAEAKEFAAKLDAAESALASARQSELERIHAEARRTQVSDHVAMLDRELDGAKASIPSLDDGLRQADARAVESRAALEKIRADIASVRSARESAARALHETEARRRAALADTAALEGRAQGLRATLQSGEGLPHGARAVLDAASKGAIPDDFTPLSSVIHARPEHAAAIEAALGSAAGDLVTSIAKHAKAAIEYLKREGAGRATFLPRDLVRLRPRPHGIADLAGEPGILGIAADLVTWAKDDKLAAELHLGGVLVATDLDAATRLAKKEGFRKIVTLEGEVVYSGGAVAGGRTTKVATGPIQRAAELEEAEARIAVLAKEIRGLDAGAATDVSRIADAENSEKALLAKLQEAETEVAEAVAWHTEIREERASTERAIQRLATELNGLSAELSSGPELPKDDETVRRLEADRNSLLAIAAGKAADAEQARRALQETEERQIASRERAQSAERELADARSAMEHRASRLSSLGDERSQQREALSAAESDLETARKTRSSHENQLDEKKSDRAALQESIQSANVSARENRETARALDDASYQDDVQRARAETKRATVLARLIEEYTTDEEEATRQAPHVSVPPDAERIANTLRREIRALGDVNLGAIEAYERLTERFEILSVQREDILESKAELDKSILELDRLTRGAFTETFEKVDIAFGETFIQLFAGGSAKLILTDPANILETGVEVEIQVPGKKTQRLELLSGGERALSACALLFALLKVKPSPLCVLDELDAPLDGRNVERYADLLRSFAERSQFIVITHNTTTIDASPIWFGVTMQEPGVSTIIPYRSRRPELITTRPEAEPAPAGVEML
jgi:chromosome segregation protein